MHQFQQYALIATCQNQDERLLAKEIINAFETASIGFESFVIPVLDLELEKFIPEGQISKFVEQVNIDALRKSAIVFDLYIPSKKWVMNITGCTDWHKGPQEYLSGAILLSVARLVDAVKGDLVKDMLVFGDKPTSLHDVLCKAVKSRLEELGITHPLDQVAPLRYPGKAKGSLFLPLGQVSSFISYVNK